MNITQQEIDYQRELDLLYRIRYNRGLIPNPYTFENPKIRELAISIAETMEELNNLDNYLDELYRGLTK